MKFRNLSGAKTASMANPVLVGTELIVMVFGMVMIGSVLTGNGSLTKRR